MNDLESKPRTCHIKSVEITKKIELRYSDAHVIQIYDGDSFVGRWDPIRGLDAPLGLDREQLANICLRFYQEKEGA